MLLCPKCGNKLVRRNAFGAVRITIPMTLQSADMSIWRCIIKHSVGMIGKW